MKNLERGVAENCPYAGERDVNKILKKSVVPCNHRNPNYCQYVAYEKWRTELAKAVCRYETRKR